MQDYNILKMILTTASILWVHLGAWQSDQDINSPLLKGNNSYVNKLILTKLSGNQVTIATVMFPKY